MVHMNDVNRTGTFAGTGIGWTVVSASRPCTNSTEISAIQLAHEHNEISKYDLGKSYQDTTYKNFNTVRSFRMLLSSQT
jgi:hypothetical protein